MSLKKSVLMGVGAVALATSFSLPAFAAADGGLGACKAQIAQDAQLSDYERVSSRMDGMKRRGRYTYFSIEVTAKEADGSSAEWTAECKARSSGRVQELQLTRVGQDSEHKVAASDS